jgi:hypothetical protein
MSVSLAVRQAKRLHHIVLRPSRQPPHPILQLPSGRQEDNRDIMLHQLRQQRKAVFSGQHHIYYSAVVIMPLLQPGAGLVAVRKRGYLISRGPQAHAYHIVDGFFIFYYQNLCIHNPPSISILP